MLTLNANRDAVLDEAIAACLKAVPGKKLLDTMGPAAYYACFADTLRGMKSSTACPVLHLAAAGGAAA